MSLAIERHPLCLDAGHVALHVRPVALDSDDWTPERAGDAVAVAGILGRVALEVEYTMRLQRREHGCATGVRRYPEDLDELVDDGIPTGCHLILGNVSDPDAAQLRPFLRLVAPANRERSWRARLARALDTVNRQNAATLTGPTLPA